MEHLTPPNVPDIIALVFVALSTVHGWRRGLSGELAQVVGVVCALLLGLYAYHPLGDWMFTNTRLTEQYGNALAFVATVAGAIVALVILRLALRTIIRVVIAEKADRAGGLLAGFVRSLLIVAIVFMAMNLWPHEYLNAKFGEESLVGRLLIRQVPSLREAGDPGAGTKPKDEAEEEARTRPVRRRTLER